ncbi:zinc ribbon domain-containing protein [Sphingomonas sp. MMS24-JH45]
MNPGLAAAGKGERAFCSWDEDVVTMAVGGARLPRRAGPRRRPRVARRLHDLPLRRSVECGDRRLCIGAFHEIETSNAAGSQRVATTALIQALGAGCVRRRAEAAIRCHDAAEIQGGAGAAAVTLGGEGVIATLLAATSRAVHFVDRFRAAGQPSDYAWEERWDPQQGLFQDRARSGARCPGAGRGGRRRGRAPDPPRRSAASRRDRGGGAARDDRRRVRGAGRLYRRGARDADAGRGAAQAGRAHPLRRFGQGVDVLLFEATDRIGSQGGRGLAGAVADRLVTSDYLRMLSFADRIALDWGMRGEKHGKAALTEQYRASDQLDSFTGGRCAACGTVQFPVLASCVNAACGTPAMAPVSLADEPAAIFTITSDWLSYHPAPPLAVGFVQFDIGARLLDGGGRRRRRS